MAAENGLFAEEEVSLYCTHRSPEDLVKIQTVMPVQSSEHSKRPEVLGLRA